MRIRGIGTAKRIAGWARSRFHGGPIILAYHRVADSAWDPQHLCVSPENFAAQLEILTRVAQPISLERVEQALSEGQQLEPSFVVTIDDGYADTLEEAAPILERFAVPATVFVTTGIIGKPFWWCEVQQMVEESAALPEKVEVRAGDYQFRWVKVSDAPRDRARLIQSIGDFFRLLPFGLQDEAVSKLWTAFNCTASDAQIKAMTMEQVSSLSESQFVDIGSHTVTHTSLQYLGAEDQRMELRKSKAELEAICGRPVTSCSYPNGRISSETPAIAKELGYSSACTSQEELVAPGCNPFLLPRLWVGDWDGVQISKWLRWWLR